MVIITAAQTQIAIVKNLFLIRSSCEVGGLSAADRLALAAEHGKPYSDEAPT
jgi:hypothetical protein